MKDNLLFNFCSKLVTVLVSLRNCCYMNNLTVLWSTFKLLVMNSNYAVVLVSLLSLRNLYNWSKSLTVNRSIDNTLVLLNGASCLISSSNN